MIQRAAPQVKTPLETLMEMNQLAYEKRRRPARPIKPSDQVEQYYRAQLREIVRAMGRAVAAEALPVLHQEKANYVSDAQFMDRWVDRIISSLARAMANFQSGVFAQQADRLARGVVSRAESATTQAFLKSVNQAVGIDMTALLSNEGLADYVEAAAHQNATLIKSIPQQYFSDIQNMVIGGIRNGDAPSKIIKAIQARTEATYNRAKLIARDQTAKLTSEINEQRQTSAGIKYYRAVDSGDERVAGRPGGKYPDAKISCWAIARQDVGYGKGVYRWDTGASYGGQTGLHPGKHHIQCRCTASPVFEFEFEGI